MRIPTEKELFELLTQIISENIVKRGYRLTSSAVKFLDQTIRKTGKWSGVYMELNRDKKNSRSKRIAFEMFCELLMRAGE